MSEIDRLKKENEQLKLQLGKLIRCYRGVLGVVNEAMRTTESWKEDVLPEYQSLDLDKELYFDAEYLFKKTNK